MNQTVKILLEYVYVLLLKDLNKQIQNYVELAQNKRKKSETVFFCPYRVFLRAIFCVHIKIYLPI